MMTKEEITRAIEAGAAKRAERQAKRHQLLMQKRQASEEEPFEFPVGFEKRLKSAWTNLERIFYKRSVLSEELTEEVKNLFFPEADDEFRFHVYRKFFHDYEALIFYAWVTSRELCDAAYRFWDCVLKNPEAIVSGNSIVRIFGARPNKNLLKIMKTHREKFLSDSVFKKILAEIVSRYLVEPGLWNFETGSFDPWSKEERQIWVEIQKLF